MSKKLGYASRLGLLSGDMIQIRLKYKKDTESVYVHRSLIVDASKYFATIKHFRERTTGVVELNDICPSTFKLVVEGLYYTDATFKSSAADMDPITTFIQVYIVADRLMMEDLQTRTLAAIEQEYLRTSILLNDYTLLESTEIPLGDPIFKQLSNHIAHLIAHRDKNWTPVFGCTMEVQRFFEQGSPYKAALMLEITLIFRKRLAFGSAVDDCMTCQAEINRW